jgi:hypothetical protein
MFQMRVYFTDTPIPAELEGVMWQPDIKVAAQFDSKAAAEFTVTAMPFRTGVASYENTWVIYKED